MTSSHIILLNATLAILVILMVGGIVALAHRLPTSAPHYDALWGNSGNPWVPSDPLPLAQLTAHERERGLARAA
jgi:hypothetical protein